MKTRFSKKRRDNTAIAENKFKVNVELEELLPQDQWIKDLILNNIDFTVTHVAAMYDLVKTVESIVKNQIPGDIVECGVYMGGSSRLIAETLKYLGDHRTIWMFDTYNGVPVPSDKDVAYWEGEQKNMREWFNETWIADDTGTNWCYTSLEDVKDNISSANYPGEIKFVKGLVEDTIPENGPSNISLLRIDVDLVQPTMHVLKNFYDRTQRHIIFDDYGFNPTLRHQVDVFFENKNNPYMYRVDSTVRHVVK